MALCPFVNLCGSVNFLLWSDATFLSFDVEAVLCGAVGCMYGHDMDRVHCHALLGQMQSRFAYDVRRAMVLPFCPQHKMTHGFANHASSHCSDCTGSVMLCRRLIIVQRVSQGCSLPASVSIVYVTFIQYSGY